LNYYDPEKIVSMWRKEKGFSPDDFLLLYAGIIGHAYKFELMLNAAKILEANEQIKFVIIGSGPEKERIVKLKEGMKLHNVFFYNTISKKEMPFVLQAIDATVIPLKKTDLSEGTIPSKVFENLAMKKPIILGVEGEAKQLFIEEGNCGLAFEPENEKDLAEKIMIIYKDRSLLKKFGENGREYVKRKFNRDNIAEDFRKVLTELYPSPSHTK